VLIVVVLLQSGRGTDLGAAFGGGSSQSLFGAGGPGTILEKITMWSAIIFIISSFSLAYFTSKTKTIFDKIPETEQTSPINPSEPQLPSQSPVPEVPDNR